MGRYASVILVVVLLMTVPGCSSRRSVAVAPARGSQENSVNGESPTALSNFIQATLKISRENTVAAEAELKQLHKRRPELDELLKRVAASTADVESRRRLADAYMEEGLLTYAFQLYQEIRATRPDDVVAEIGIARVWDRWGEYGLAQEHAERAVILGPRSPEALEMLGRTHLHRNHLDLALSAFLSALEFGPQNAPLLTTTGYVFLKRGDLKQARVYLEQAVAIDDTIVEAHNNLGIVLARLGDRQRALREFMTVNDPPAAFNNLGVAYMEQKQWHEASDAFRHALALDSGHSKARENLAEADAHIPPPAVVHLQPLKGNHSVVVASEAKTSTSSRDVVGEPKKGVTKKGSRISVAYQDALGRFRVRRYHETIDILEWLLLQYPNDRLASNCQYWIGESYYALADYKKAYVAFERVTSYEASPKRADARLMMKRAAVKQRRSAKA